jgi:hypothetical protein
LLCISLGEHYAPLGEYLVLKVLWLVQLSLIT